MIEAIDSILKIFAGLTAPITAIVAVYIAYQQHVSNKQKLRFELYDRRLKVYEEVRSLIHAVCRDADVSFEILAEFRPKVAEADFLFGNDIVLYIEGLYHRAIRLRSLNHQYRDSYQERPPGYNHQQIVDEKHIELEWLVNQLEPAKEKFSKYLRIEDA